MDLETEAREHTEMTTATRLGIFPLPAPRRPQRRYRQTS